MTTEVVRISSPSRAPTENLTEKLMARADKVLLGNYNRQPIAIVRGEGCYVWDIEGRRYLDLLGGIATCALGHCHPAVISAARKQLETLWHIANTVYSQPCVELAERIQRGSGIPNAKVFFANSGGEANEAMVKLARRYHHVVRGDAKRSTILTFESSFHGRTLAMTAATGQAKYQQGFEPLPAGFQILPFGDLNSVAKAIDGTTAAILVETIQGEGGVRLQPPGFIAALRKLCTDAGILLLIDEVQTAMGRTGKPFSFQHCGILPDAFSLAKALGNGLPIGAMVCSESIAGALPPGTHGSTFGGNPVATAAACAAWDIIMSEPLLQEVTDKGEHFLRLARALQERVPGKIREVRGLGLLMGVELVAGASEVLARCREGGVLVNLAGPNTIRFAPSLLVSKEELEFGLLVLERALN